MPKIKNVRKSNIALPENYFVVFFGGSVYNKLWPAENFYKVAYHIAEKTGLIPLLCGLKTDKEQERAFAASGDLKYYSLVGKTTMCDLVYLISKAKLVIGNDTCASHIANATGVPSLTVKGQFSGEKFFPYEVEKKNEDDIYPFYVCSDVHCKWCTLRNGGYFCMHGDYYAKKTVKCLMRVSAEDAIKEADKLLEKHFNLK
jgi:ADP-heptose:LPS heptosyltransferase